MLVQLALTTDNENSDDGDDIVMIMTTMTMMMTMMYSVAKDSSSALVLKLTLHSLISRWEPDLNFISDDHCTHDGTDACTALCSRPCITQLVATDSESFHCSVSRFCSSGLLVIEKS